MPIIRIQANKKDVPNFRACVLRQRFRENMCHELAHYFYGLTPNVPDANHEVIAKYGSRGNGNQVSAFHANAPSFAFNFQHHEEEEEDIKNVIADLFPNPLKPTDRDLPRPIRPVLRTGKGEHLPPPSAEGATELCTAIFFRF